METQKVNGEVMKAEPTGNLDYYRVLQAFEGHISGGNGTINITEFLGAEAEKALKETGIGAKLDPELDLWDFINSCHNLSFAVGYLFGHEFKIRDLEVLSLIESLKERMIEQGALTFTGNHK